MLDGKNFEHEAKSAWSYFIVAPVVFVCVTIAVGLALAAAWQNIRLANATSQVLGIVAIARNIPLKDIDTAILAEQLSRIMSLKLVRTKSPYYGEASVWAYTNPWQDLTIVTVSPFLQELSWEAPVSPSVCRRLLGALSRDISGIGVNTIAVHDAEYNISNKGTGWRQVYHPPSGSILIDDNIIQTGCGNSEKVILAVVFRLH